MQKRSAQAERNSKNNNEDPFIRRKMRAFLVLSPTKEPVGRSEGPPWSGHSGRCRNSLRTAGSNMIGGGNCVRGAGPIPSESAVTRRGQAWVGKRCSSESEKSLKKSLLQHHCLIIRDFQQTRNLYLGFGWVPFWAATPPM